MYYLDHGKYPSHPEMYYFAFTEGGKLCGHASGSSQQGAWCDLEELLAPYIPSLPRAHGDLREYLYKTKNASSKQHYALGVRLETSNSAATNDGGLLPTWYEVGDLTQCGEVWHAWTGTTPSCF